MLVDKAATKTLSALIVEDERDVASWLAELLAMEGFGVTITPNGQDALRYLKRATRPTVIVLDLMMPVMDGWSFLAEKRLLPNALGVPVVVLSASSTGLGAADRQDPDATFLRKPVSTEKLLDAVYRAIE